MLADGREDTPSLLEQRFGVQGPENWKMGGRLPEADIYRDVDSQHPVGLEPGVAYWLGSTEDQAGWSLPGETSFPPDSKSHFEIELKPGWNMVGNPAAYPITLDQSRLLVSTDGSSRETYDDAANRLVSAQIYFYDPESPDLGPPPYDTTRVDLIPWEGCFIKNLDQQSLTLYIPAEEVVSTQASRTRQAKSPDLLWSMTILATSGTETSKVEIALATNASHGLDRHDVLLPPGPPDQMMAVGLRLEEPLGLGTATEILSRDVRPESTSGLEWHFGVSSPGASVELRWSDVGGNTSGSHSYSTSSMMLLEEATGRQWNMTQVRSLGLPAGEHSLRLIARGDIEIASNPEAVRVRMGPNPIRAISEIALDIPEPASVRLEVFEIGGARVWNWERVNLPAGTHVILWNTRDTEGRPVPGGTYFYRVEVQSDSGPRLTGPMIATGKFSILR
jgi:hypothetical protein